MEVEESMVALLCRWFRIDDDMGWGVCIMGVDTMGNVVSHSKTVMVIVVFVP